MRVLKFNTLILSVAKDLIYMLILEKIIKYSLYLVLLLPLAFTKSTMFPWHFGKTIYFQIGIEIVVILAAVYLIFSQGKRVNNFKFNLLDGLVLIFLAVLLISSFLGVNFQKSFWGNQARAQGIFTWWHFIIFYFLLRLFISSSEQWKKIVEWVVYISAVSSLVGWLGYLSAGALKEYVIETGRIAGIIGNPIFFANYLLLPTYFAFWWWLNNRELRRRWLIFGIGLFNILTLFFTSARGAMVGLIAGFFVFWLFFVFMAMQEKNKIAKKIFLIGLVLLVLGGVLYAVNLKTDIIRKTMPALSNTLAISLESATAQTRLMAWQIAFKGFLERPFWGWGPENYQDVFDKYYNPNFLKYSFAETVWDKPHNFFLEILSGSGLVGGLAYLSLILYLAWRIIKRIMEKQKTSQGYSAGIFFSALIAYIVALSFSFETSNSLILWFFFLALINFYLFNQLADDKKENNYRQKTASIKLINLVFAILAVVSFWLIPKNFTLLKASQAMAKARDLAEVNDLYNWQKAAPEIFKIKVPFISEQAIYVTKDLSNFDGRGELNKDILTAVQADLIKIFQAEINYDRNSFVARMWLGQLYAFLGEYVDNKFFIESEKIYIEAGKINSERQHIPMLLSKTYLLEGKDDLAIGVLTQLVNNNPNLPEPHWFLGLALVKKGDTSKGLIELEKGMEFGIGFKSNIFYLIDLYSQLKQYEKIPFLYQRLIADEPNNARYWAALAVTYQATGDLDLMMEALNKAVELDPSLKSEAEEFLKMNNIKF